MKTQATIKDKQVKKLQLKKESIRVFTTDTERPTGWWCVRTSRDC